jgi:8-oxo-dGTP pyrophosphatase MutT (NUDIX family)
MKKHNQEIDAAGVVVYNNQFLLMYDRKLKVYDFPQGHWERGETLQQTALREIAEETGCCDLKIIIKLGRYQYHFVKNRKTVYKRIDIYLVKALSKKRVKRMKHESDRYSIRFVSYAKAMKMLSWEQDKKYLQLGYKALTKSKK